MGKRATAGAVIEGKYRLERELGAGGMGAVWLATQLMVDRPVAVKLLHPAFVDQDDLQARFEVEAKAIGRLNHPNVITLYDFGFSTDLNAFYTVIEFIDGVSLDKRLSERMPLSEVAAIIRQIALALDHAHHHSILHRDLKPENVMLARMTDGTEMVKVLDFGIARIVKGQNDKPQAESQRITKAGEVFGTPAYMSPEQARSIRQLEPSADLYSLGVMFYELTTGSLPFFAHSAFDLLMLHVTKPVPPIRRPDVPKELADLIYRLLEKEPEKRFQSGKELVKAIDSLVLPDEEISFDDLEGQPTTVQAFPTPTLGVPRPGDELAEETNPGSVDELALPTPSGALVPGSAEQQARSTLMLHGGGTPSTTLDTMPPGSTGRNTGIIALIIVLAIALSAATFRVLFSNTETTTADAAETTTPKPADDPEEKVVAEAAADAIALDPPAVELPGDDRVRPTEVAEEVVIEEPADPIAESPKVAAPAKPRSTPTETAPPPAEEPRLEALETKLEAKPRPKKRRRPRKKDAVDLKVDL